MDSRVNNPPIEPDIENIKNTTNRPEVNNGNVTINSFYKYCFGLISRICNYSTTEDSTSVSLDQHDVQKLLDSPELKFSTEEGDQILNKFSPTVGKVDTARKLVLHQTSDETGALPIPAQRLSRWEQLADKFVLPMQIVKQIKDGLMSNKIILSDQDADALALGICRIVNDRIIKGPADKINLRERASRDIGKDQIIPSVVFSETSKGKFEMTPESVRSKYDCWIEMPNTDQVIVTIDMINKLGEGTFKKVFQGVSFSLDLTKKNRGMDSEQNAIARFKCPSDQAEMQINRELYGIAPNAIASPSRLFLPNPAGDVDPTVTTQAYLGSDLDHVIKNKTFLPEEMWSKFIPLWEGLEAIHQQHWVHRDVKMLNILVPENGVFVFADFGLSQKMGASLIVGEYLYWNLAARIGFVLPPTDVYGLVMTMCENYFEDFTIHLKKMESPIELTIYSQNKMFENLDKILSSQPNLLKSFKSAGDVFSDNLSELPVSKLICKNLRIKAEGFKESLRLADLTIVKISYKIKCLEIIYDKDNAAMTEDQVKILTNEISSQKGQLEGLVKTCQQTYINFLKTKVEINEKELRPTVENQLKHIELIIYKIAVLMDSELNNDEKKCLLSANIEFLMQSTMAFILDKISKDDNEIIFYIDENCARLQPGGEPAFCDEIMKELKPTSAADIHKQLQETQSQIEKLIKQRNAL